MSNLCPPQDIHYYFAADILRSVYTDIHENVITASWAASGKTASPTRLPSGFGCVAKAVAARIRRACTHREEYNFPGQR
jgi:hypothetical protein